MKRVLLIAAFALVVLTVPAGSASAQTLEECTTGYPPVVVDCVDPNTGTVPPPPSAFTGTDVTVPVAAIGSFLVLGFAALFVARRRSRDAQPVAS